MTMYRIAFALLLFAAASCAAKENNTESMSSADTVRQSDEVSVQADEVQAESVEEAVSDAPETQNIPLGVKALLKAYPDFISGYADNNIIFTDGSRMTYDDGEKKNFDRKLDYSDIEDMFGMAYAGTDSIPGYLDDAGRSRCDALFKKMYGTTEGAVRKKLVNVPWFGSTVQFSNANGAADSLRKVQKELSQMTAMRPYLKSSGTFYWRKVRGANRMSAHSYGIAFDIGVDKSDYWKWKNPNAKETDKIKYHNRIPKEIVEVFEKYGFIWGGAWYHFDTMHFEFRPEILEYRRLQKTIQTD